VRVLVADDAVLFRRLLTDVLASLPGVEVVGSAANGKIALQKVRELKPDLLTLDIEMPEMDGLAVLDALVREALLHNGQRAVEVIVVSADCPRGGDLTMRALEKGAFDFITKPKAANPDQAREALLADLAPRIRAVAHRLEVRTILRGSSPQGRQEWPAAPAGAADQAVPPGSSLDGVARRMQSLSHAGKPEMVLIGVSTGGPAALARLLPAIPRDIGVPILIVQHMPPIFTKSLADSLAAKCAVGVREAAQGERIERNTAYIAPGGRQMRLEAGTEGQPIIELTDDPPENNCRPAVDYLFRSAANRFPGRSMAVILTGMGNDGALGLRLLKRQGCFVIAQDEASCVVYGMPKAAVEAGVADVVLPLEGIANRIVATVRGGRG
jgi:two-component system, chemotaxis family, protein-glutamate methylesterase/glutaminase